VRVALLSIGIIAACGCGKKKEEKPPPPAPAAELFVIATPRVTDAPIPARFTAPLPVTVDDLARPLRTPPGPVIAAGLRTGDAAIQEKVVSALERAATGGTIPQQIAGYYAGLVDFFPSDAACEWLLSLATGTRPAPVRAWAWDSLVDCHGPGTAEAFARADAPDAAVIKWHAHYEGRDVLQYAPRFVDAAANIARTADDRAAHNIGFAFAATRDPRALDDVAALQRTIADPRRRALIALGLKRHPDPQARVLVRAACAVLADDPLCKDPDAATLLSDDDLPPRPPRDPALEERLTELAFPPRPDAPRAFADDPSSAADLLVERGWAQSFDMETGQFPNDHDALLADLALLVRPALDGVVFEERPPTLDPTTGETRGPYELRAYADGKRYELLAEDRGDWYDVPAVLGLLNALLAARGSDRRFLSVSPDPQFATIIGGPARALHALVAAKLVDVAPFAVTARE
jgi:hypothetical protein